MVVDERSRHQLHVRLEEILGAEAAAVLMEHLPPVGWADVATKRDLDQLRADFKREHEVLRADFKHELDTLEQKMLAALRGELLHQTRTFMLAMSGSVVAVGSLAFAAARLV